MNHWIMNSLLKDSSQVFKSVFFLTILLLTENFLLQIWIFNFPRENKLHENESHYYALLMLILIEEVCQPCPFGSQVNSVAKPQQADCQNVARMLPKMSMAVGRNLLAGVDPLFSEACLWGCGGWGEGGLLEGDGAWGVLGAEGVLSLACGGSSFSLISSIWGLSFFRSPLPLWKQHAGQQRTIFYTHEGLRRLDINSRVKNMTVNTQTFGGRFGMKIILVLKNNKQAYKQQFWYILWI